VSGEDQGRGRHGKKGRAGKEDHVPIIDMVSYRANALVETSKANYFKAQKGNTLQRQAASACRLCCNEGVCTCGSIHSPDEWSSIPSLSLVLRKDRKREKNLKLEAKRE